MSLISIPEKEVRRREKRGEPDPVAAYLFQNDLAPGDKDEDDGSCFVKSITD